MTKFFFAFILAFLVIIYRPAIFNNKIVFPSNFLASFYSPWSLEKFPGWEQGIPNKPLGADMFRFFYPSRTFSNTAIKSGQIPLWNPYIFAGNPHLADFQSAIFYPLSSLYLFLPQLPAWSILVAVQPLLATIFCYLFLTCFPIKKLAVYFGAFAFGFSGFVVTWSQEAMAVGHSVIWLPLILYGLEKFSQNKKLNFLLLTVFALTCSILAGYLQTTLYISAFVVAYGLYRQIKIRWLLAIFILALTLSAIQIVPSLESFYLSARPTATIEKVFDTYLLPATHLVKLIAPDINGNPAVYNYFGKGSYNETALYIGLIPLIFAIYAIFKRKKIKHTGFFLVAAAVSYLLTSDFFLTRWFLHLPLPLIPTFQPSRILILTTFSLAVLAAFGLSHWLEEKKDNKIIGLICLGLAGILLLDLGFLRITVWNRDWLIAVKNSLLPLVMLVFLMLTLVIGRRRWLVIVVILGLTIFGQYYFFNKYVVLGDKEFLYRPLPVTSYLQDRAKSYDRYIALEQPIYGDFATQMRIYSPEGYDPIFSKRYGQLIFASRDFMEGKLSEDIPRIEVILSQIEKNPENSRRSRLLSLLGVKNILYFTGQWQFLENQQALPRAFLVGDAITETDPQKILNKIFDPGFDLHQILILEETVPEVLDKNTGSAQIISYQPLKVEVQTKTLGPKLLFLSDNYYPGWKATIDGKLTKIYRADFAFRAVLVPAGEHLVDFRYEPVSFEVGKNITLVSLLLLGGLLLLFSRNPHWTRKFGWK